MRQCIATMEKKPKKELFRIVRTPDGDVVYDPTGKKNGRGTYLSKDAEAIKQAKQGNILAKHLKTDVNEELYDELLLIVEEERNA